MSITGTYWKYKNLSVFSYTASDPREKQTLSDWNRLIDAKKLCTYYIGAKQLSELREGQPFTDVEELKTFFKMNLFFNMTNQENLVNQACYHFHQQGFPHATHFCLNNLNESRFKASKPETKIVFMVTDKGLLIKEENRYKGLVDK